MENKKHRVNNYFPFSNAGNFTFPRKNGSQLFSKILIDD